MTREEAAKRIELLIRDGSIEDGTVIDVYDMDALDMAIKALEQPECEDAVSRQEAIKAIESVPDGNWRNVRYSNVLRKLPSVTPRRKVGKWDIEDKYKDKYGDIIRICICDQCGHVHHYAEGDTSNGDDSYSNYCPNCGAKMEDN